MWLQIDARSPVPIYQQIVDGVKAAVAKDVLKPGDKIPSIRELAVDLMLNHNTVAKAYRELERSKVIEVLRGRGTFVAETNIAPDRAERIRDIRNQMERMLIEAHHLQVTDDQLVFMLKEVITQWNQDSVNVTRRDEE
ncbi:GntR family transcriptional regulator [Alicyclobacillus sp. SO9]|uniref:GntR family transcriptional regulator n=1 Tax=Alicyclobacillus sp. SO9 TaxID=2665646 RepID=UPI0018E8888D|nr:GntR family transcriptional regulator [Alicyclobacillus sp. SO9]QQE79871.1 GntR family transcriptional regulator [Alicyclobacillus sp. SO9]